VTAKVNLLLYVAHTSSAVREQALYSALSALAHKGGAPLILHVYTDAPEAFARLEGRAELRRVGQDDIRGWKGPLRFNHRAKPAAMLDLAARHPGDKLLFADADTVFTGPVSALFARIGPAAAVMHEREYHVATSDLAVMHRFRRRLKKATFRGAPVEIGWEMWNSGAVGIDPTHAAVLGEWLAFVDEVYPRARRWLVEQYGIACLLQRRGLALSEAADVVVHYWFDKDGYVAALRSILDATRGLSLDETLAFVRANPIERPRRATSYGKNANLFQRVFGW
jgi:hypothetical protein